ncbi:MAG: hypothetical protein HC838_06625 [Spirulinaceae cyanobacterium RM2_2_10]|nr:hypothetical protein [Spirulinaceae cyanobacterium SM2_1_0]NJO19798.1 hypothetical protein [Spirulinaceae cyanobacterium RM2_2_10]
MRDRLTLIVAASLTCSTLTATVMPNAAVANLRRSDISLGAIAQATDEADPSTSESPSAPAEADSSDSSEEPAIKRGDSGPEVRELQMRLERLEIYEGGISGEYDEATEAAVRTFQEQNDIEPTGIFNVETWRKLDDIQNPRPPQNRRWFRMSRRRWLALIAGGGFVLVAGSIGGGMLLLRMINREPEVAEAAPDADTDASPTEIPEAADAASPASTSGIATTGMPPVRSTAIPPNFKHAAQPHSEPSAPPPPKFEDVLVEPVAPLPPVEPEPELLQPAAKPLLPPTLDANFDDDNCNDAPLETPLPAAPREPLSAHNGLNASEPLLQARSPALVNLDRVDQLIRELREPDAGQRQQAIWELAQQADSRAVQPLVNLLLDSDSQQQSLILEALSQIGTRALKPMNRALALSLQDDDAHVRKNAIRDLTRIYELVAQLSQLIYYATDDPDPDVQETARWALGQLNNIRVPNHIAQGDRHAPPS